MHACRFISERMASSFISVTQTRTASSFTRGAVSLSQWSDDSDNFFSGGIAAVVQISRGENPEVSFCQVYHAPFW